MRTEYKYAAIISAILFLWLCVEFWLGFNDAYVDFLPISSLLTLAVWGILLHLEIREKRSKGIGRRWSYSRGFRTAFLTTLLALPLLLLSRWVFYDLINPDFFNNVTIKGREWISASAQTEDNFNNSVKMMEDFFDMKAYQSITVVFNFLTGLFFSLILPSFSVKNRG
jgi:hypothetical protein